MKCLECEKEFKALRATAKFCSDTCKKRYARKSVPLKNVPLTPNESVPLKKEFSVLAHPQGFCHACGKENPPAFKNIQCICLACVTKGITHESLGLDINACK